MSVLILAYNVVVKRETVEQKYPGGIRQYARNSPNATYCHDDHLARIGFMAYDDALTFVKNLQEHLGFEAQEIAIVDQMRGLLASRSWLECARHQDGWALCWLKGTDPTKLAAPAGWSPEKARQGQMRFVSANEVNDLEFLRHENNVDVYRNKATNQLEYVGRVSDAAEEGQPAQPKDASKSFWKRLRGSS